MGAVNLGKLATMMEWPDMEAAFVLGGRVGAYTPMNPYTFPLDCAATDFVISMGHCSTNSTAGVAGKAGCRPEAVTISGNTWSDCPTNDMSSLEGVEKCAEGKCAFSPAGGGMGAIYVDGKYTPYALALRMLKNAQGSRQLEISKEVAVRLKAANVTVMAWQSADSRFASVLLTNVDRYNTRLDSLIVAKSMVWKGSRPRSSWKVAFWTRVNLSTATLTRSSLPLSPSKLSS